MNFWSTQEEIKFFDQMLNSNFLAIEKVFYNPKSVRVTYSMRKQAKLNRIGAGFSS